MIQPVSQFPDVLKPQHSRSWPKDLEIKANACPAVHKDQDNPRTYTLIDALTAFLLATKI